MQTSKMIPLARLSSGPAGVATADVQPREGWQIIETDMTHAELLDRLIAAVPQENMGVVTQAGPPPWPASAA